MSKFKKFIFVVFFVVTICLIIPVKAQDYFGRLNITKLAPHTPILFPNNLGSNIKFSCIKIDGRCQFNIAAPANELRHRIEIIEQRLKQIIQIYLQGKNVDLEVKIKSAGKLKDIYVVLGERELRLMTVTSWDAEIDNTDIENKADLIKFILEENIPKTKEERKFNYLIAQVIIASIIAALLLGLQILIARWQRRLKQSKQRLIDVDNNIDQPIYTQLTNKQKINFQEVQYRLLQLLNLGLWILGILLILGLFPYTRFWQGVMVELLRIPVKLTIISSITYVSIRLSYGLINKFSSIIINDIAPNTPTNQRLQLRVTTISAIVRSIITIAWIAMGIITGLLVIGVNIGPVLAGLGIFSLALSLGSQNLIKDAINGFFIVWEDQFAVGDVINVGNVGGLVENMNLRITQLRDAEGRLITIPNSEITVVANLSSKWARADLDIPVAYETDVDQALSLITQVTEIMSQEEDWHDKIVDRPEILGVDNFGDRGLIIKVWIKTQPLQQWAVSREFRRRLKVAFDGAGIPIPPPQREIWIKQP